MRTCPPSASIIRRRAASVAIAAFFFTLGMVSEAVARSWQIHAPGPDADCVLFAALIGLVTAFPEVAIVLGYLLPSDSKAVYFAVLAVCSLAWAWVFRTAREASLPTQRTFVLLAVAGLAVGMVPWACWWSGPSACPAGPQDFATFQATLFDDLLDVDGFDWEYGLESPDLVAPQMRLKITLAGTYASAVSAIVCAAVLTGTAAGIRRHRQRITQRQPPPSPPASA